MIGAMLVWRDLNAEPRVTAANDNFAGDDYEGVEELVPFNHDNRLLHDTGDRTLALYEAGEPWEPDEERFSQPHRNDPARSIPVGSYAMNGATYVHVDAESEMNRAIDCKRARKRLGPVCSQILDAAAGGSTTREIAMKCRTDDLAQVVRYIDHAIIQFMRDPAFAEYSRAA